MRPVTNAVAKPAIPFLNVPLLFWSLDLLRELNPDRVVANLHHMPDTVRALAPLAETNGPPLTFTHEVAAPLGSGGALWFAKKEFEGLDTILVANADEVILPANPETLRRMHEQHERTGALATLLTMRHAEAGTKFGGVWVNDTHAVQGFGKDGSSFPNATQTLHYVGVILLSRRIFNYLPEGESNLLYDAVARGISKGERVNAFCEELVWYETGNPKDFLIASRAVLDLLASTSRRSNPGVMVQHVIDQYAPAGTARIHSGVNAHLLISPLMTGSLLSDEIQRALEKENAWAVIGANASVRSAVINSVVLPNATVHQPVRDQIVV